MAVVYRATDPLLGRNVAIKVVNEVYIESLGVSSKEYYERFQREAEVAGCLNHPNIVKVFDVGSDYIVMELVEGQTLDAVLRAKNRFALSRILEIVSQVADALDEAHGQGIVHRDIKPANIMLRPDGSATVMDFGLARIEASTLTAAGEILGSASYMAPEVVLGAVADARSDIFALGVVTYELMTGERPFAGPSISSILLKIVREQAPSAHGTNLNVPPDYDDIFAKVLAKEPASRYACASDFVVDLNLKKWADRDPLLTEQAPDHPRSPDNTAPLGVPLPPVPPPPHEDDVGLTALLDLPPAPVPECEAPPAPELREDDEAPAEEVTMEDDEQPPDATFLARRVPPPNSEDDEPEEPDEEVTRPMEPAVLPPPRVQLSGETTWGPSTSRAYRTAAQGDLRPKPRVAQEPGRAAEDVTATTPVTAVHAALTQPILSAVVPIREEAAPPAAVSGPQAQAVTEQAPSAVQEAVTQRVQPVIVPLQEEAGATTVAPAVAAPPSPPPQAETEVTPPAVQDVVTQPVLPAVREEAPAAPPASARPPVPTQAPESVARASARPAARGREEGAGPVPQVAARPPGPAEAVPHPMAPPRAARPGARPVPRRGLPLPLVVGGVTLLGLVMAVLVVLGYVFLRPEPQAASQSPEPAPSPTLPAASVAQAPVPLPSEAAAPPSAAPIEDAPPVATESPLEAVTTTPAPPPVTAVEPVTLVVISQPPGARVRAGRATGHTPARLVLGAGAVTVVIEKEGFKPWRRSLDLVAGSTEKLTARLEPLAPPTPRPPEVKLGDLVAITADVTPPRKIWGESPVYPERAQKARVGGSVLVEFIVTESGAVSHPKIVQSAGDILDGVCLDTVALWRYEPASKAGVRVKVVQQARFTFEAR